MIDKVEVRLVASEDKFWAQLSNFGDKYVHIPEQLIYTYERLLQGGVWCQLDLIYKGRCPAIKEQIVDMALNGSGIRDTARVLKISPTTVLNELKKKSQRSAV